jgi:hypothetical protein
MAILRPSDPSGSGVVPDGVEGFQPATCNNSLKMSVDCFICMLMVFFVPFPGETH